MKVGDRVICLTGNFIQRIHRGRILEIGKQKFASSKVPPTAAAFVAFEDGSNRWEPLERLAKSKAP